MKTVRRPTRTAVNRALVARILARSKKFMLRDLRNGTIRPVTRFSDLYRWVEASEYVLNSRGNYDAQLQRLAERGDGFEIEVINAHLNRVLVALKAWVEDGALTRAAAVRPTTRSRKPNSLSAAEIRPSASYRAARVRRALGGPSATRPTPRRR